MSNHPPDRIVVIGAGECGARATMALRELGFSGSVTLVGDEPDVGYERPPLSKASLTSDAGPEPVWAVAPDRFAECDVRVVADTAASAIDRAGASVTLSDGTAIGYDRLLLTTGATPRRLGVPGGELVHLLRTVRHARSIRSALRTGSRVAIIGAGLIGLEVAAAARRLGADVTVIEAAAVALGRGVPPGVADVLVKRHTWEGVTFHFDTHVEAIERVAGRLAVVTGTGDIECDVAIAGIGVTPNAGLAATAGLLIDDGIAVDARLRTSDPSIFAAGDCCSFPHPLFDHRRLRLESWRNAVDQSATVAGNMLGADEAYSAVPWFWSDQYDLGLQLAGLAAHAARWVVRERSDGTSVQFGLDAAGRIVAACGVAPGTAIARDVRVAELMIAARLHPDPAALADSHHPLKSLMIRRD